MITAFEIVELLRSKNWRLVTAESCTGGMLAAAITDIAILAIEGERDDISGIGQTKAALKISTGLPEAMKKYHVAKGAGHYGIFNGSKWRDGVAPVVEDWIARHTD